MSTFERGVWSDKLIENRGNETVVERGAYSELLNLTEDIWKQLQIERNHSASLQDSLIDLQSEDIRNTFPDEAVDMAAMLIHEDKYHPCDLQEIAEHLQAYVKNAWGE